MLPPLHIRRFTTPETYEPLFDQMREYTLQRSPDSLDAIWLLEHTPVFTQGQAGKKEHILDPGNIPVIQSDRGGQITYHGPGQLMIYTLFDLKRLNMGIKQFVHCLESGIIQFLSRNNIIAQRKSGAPGVYVSKAKICSLGLRVRKGCTYHGLSLNVNMDLSPFSRINPCGFPFLKMTQLCDYIPTISVSRVMQEIVPYLVESLGVNDV